MSCAHVARRRGDRAEERRVCARTRAIAARTRRCRAGYRSDVDGDGSVLSMRREDPSGEYVADPDLPGLMLPRRWKSGPVLQALARRHDRKLRRHARARPAYLSDTTST